MDAKALELKRQVTHIAKKGNILEELYALGANDSDLSHTIFQLFPTNESRQLEACDHEPVSAWVLRRLLSVYETCEAYAIAKLYRVLSLEPSAETFRRCLFERQVLTYFDRTDSTRKLSIRGLTNPEKTTWTYRGPIPFFTFLQDESAADEIKRAVEAVKLLHLIPSAPNFEAVDSIVYDPNEVLTCVQITLNMKQPIATKDLNRIQKWTSLAKLHPDKGRPWRFIFVVPSYNEEKFELQRIVGRGNDGWAEMVDQYVLGLPEKTVFGMRPRPEFNEQGEWEQPVRC